MIKCHSMHCYCYGEKYLRVKNIPDKYNSVQFVVLWEKHKSYIFGDKQSSTSICLCSPENDNLTV